MLIFSIYLKSICHKHIYTGRKEKQYLKRITAVWLDMERYLIQVISEKGKQYNATYECIYIKTKNFYLYMHAHMFAHLYLLILEKKTWKDENQIDNKDYF